MFLAVMRKFALDLDARAAEINDLNVFPVPDSDTGSNSALTMAAGLSAAADLELAAAAGLSEVTALIAGDCSKNALGNSGIILSEYLRGIGTVLDDVADVTQWSYALKVGAITAREALLTPEEGTMLSVADAAAKVEPDSNFQKYLIRVQSEVRAELSRTQFMLPPLQAAGVVDAGAVVITLLHDAIAKEFAESNLAALVIDGSSCLNVSSDYSGPRFELMFSFTGSEVQKNHLQVLLTDLGDSVSISGSDATFNFHIHTDSPDEVVALSRETVSVGEIRIQDLQADS